MPEHVANDPKFVMLHDVVFRAPTTRAVSPVRAWLGVAYFVVLAVWSLAATWHTHPWLGVLAALLYLEFGLLGARARTVMGEVELDEATATRIAHPLRALCAKAGCAVPRVAVLARGGRVAYVVGARRGATQLVLTRGLLEHLGDLELQAVVAHEVSHLAAGDLRRIRSTLWRLLAGSIACYFVLGFFFAGDDLPFPIFVAMGIPVAYAVLIVAAVSRRPLELRADQGAVGLTADAGSLMTALEKVTTLSDEARRQFFAGPWRWLLFAFSWKLPTHPKLQDRLEQLSALATLPGPSSN